MVQVVTDVSPLVREYINKEIGDAMRSILERLVITMQRDVDKHNKTVFRVFLEE